MAIIYLHHGSTFNFTIIRQEKQLQTWVEDFSILPESLPALSWEVVVVVATTTAATIAGTTAVTSAAMTAAMIAATIEGTTIVGTTGVMIAARARVERATWQPAARGGITGW